MKILIATEGSKFSRAAIDLCGRIFGHSEAVETKIIVAFEPMIPPTEPFMMTADYVRKVDSESRQAANEIAVCAKEQLQNNFPVLTGNMTIEVVSGSPARAVVEMAEKWGADLIVVGSHGYGFWKRAYLGSVSNSVVQHAPCSVLVARSSLSKTEENNK